MEPKREPLRIQTGDSLQASTSGEPYTTKRFYTVTEAANLLRVSAPTLYREIRAGRFPAIRVRGRYVIPAKAVDAMEQAALANGIVDPGELGLGAAPS
jgi:excisionase family DNA binding protein